MSAQVLDSMDIEKERGITIKAQTAALKYKALDGQVYHLNLIDTPGHVDFSYEVSRSLSACEGALLVVDASQGVEAQTVANCYTALDLGVTVVPVLNKMDLPQADPENAKQEIEEVIGIDATDAIPCSAKTGMGIDEILEAVIARIPPPRGNPDAALRAMIIDSWYDSYVGVVMLVRVVDGRLAKGDRIKLMASEATYNAEQLGVEVVPVLNKMDLPQADPENAKQEIEEVIGIDATDAIPCSAKTGMGIDEILEAVVARIPPPQGNPDGALRAMIIDSWYDAYVGVVMLVRVVDGRLAKGDTSSSWRARRCTTPSSLAFLRRIPSHVSRWRLVKSVL